MDTNLKNSDDLEKRNVANENIVRENIVKKSHNWKILGIIAMILTIFIAAGTTVGLYPYMEEKAAEFSSRNRRQETEAAGGFGNLATQVMNFSYVLWHQQKQEENGGILTYSQTFLAGDGIGAVDVLHGEDAQNVPETEKKTDPVSGADAVVSADVAENVVATESADHTSGQTLFLCKRVQVLRAETLLQRHFVAKAYSFIQQADKAFHAVVGRISFVLL